MGVMPTRSAMIPTALALAHMLQRIPLWPSSNHIPSQLPPLMKFMEPKGLFHLEPKSSLLCSASGSQTLEFPAQIYIHDLHRPLPHVLPSHGRLDSLRCAQRPGGGPGGGGLSTWNVDKVWTYIVQ